MRLSFVLTAILAAAPLAPISAQSYDDMVAATDMTNPDDLVALAAWCKENGRNRSSTRHLREALAIDTNHPGARMALGFVWYNERWVHESRLPSGAAARRNDGGNDSGGGGGRRRPTTPGPAAADVAWDLTLPADPAPDEPYGPFLADRVVPDFNRVDNYSGAMDSAVATLFQADHPEYLPKGVYELCKAMTAANWQDLYGPASMILKAYQEGTPAQQRIVDQMLPFMVKASERTRDSMDLYMFGLAVGQIGDKRVVPRLIEMLGSSDRDIQDAAKAGIALITMLPENEITPASAKDWWDRYHNASDSLVFTDMLGPKNPPMTRYRACERLYRGQDKAIMPVLMDLMEGDDMPAAIAAATLVERICGNNWGVVGGTSQDERRASVERLRAWWDERKHTFIWLEFRNQPGADGSAPARRNPLQDAISRLSSIEAGTAETAMGQLRDADTDAVSWLIDGLAHPSDIVIRTRCRDLLREITGQNFGFEPSRGSDADRGRAREAWIEWATGEGILSAPDDEG